jgi:hypothetical protein
MVLGNTFQGWVNAAHSLHTWNAASHLHMLVIMIIPLLLWWCKCCQSYSGETGSALGRLYYRKLMPSVLYKLQPRQHIGPGETYNPNQSVLYW